MNILSEKMAGSANWNKLHWAVAFAILMHAVGLIGMVFVNRPLFVSLTPLNLIIMPLLIFPFVKGKISRFLLFFLICFLAGWFSEWIGVKTGWLFGTYSYGNVLGFKVGDVPLLIGLNWFMVVYCSAAWVKDQFKKMHFRILRIDNRFLAIFKELVFLISVAVMAVIYDFFLEPVAIRSGYWTWAGDGTIPLKNYLCWFGLSFLLASAGRLLNVNPSNRMASVLFSIQLIFFIILGMIPG